MYVHPAVQAERDAQARRARTIVTLLVILIVLCLCAAGFAAGYGFATLA